MKIAIDMRPLMAGKISGVEVYMENMLKALFELDKENQYILWYNAFKPAKIRLKTDQPNVKWKRTRIPNKILNLCQSLLRWPKVDKLIGEKIDILWVPDPRPAPVTADCKKVITFHDLSFVDFRHAFNLKTRLWHKVLRPRKEAEEADHIIAVSQFTKEKLQDEYGIAPEKISVIYEAADPGIRPLPIPRSFEIIQRKYKLPERYFLFLSTLEPRKNLAGVVEAFRKWREETRADVSLVLAGQDFPGIFNRVFIKSDPHIYRTGFVDEQDKGLLYQHAIAFLYPSFYEGFGLPILEAMQCGTPVVTSDCTAMPEVAGDAAMLINPNDPDQLKQALHKMYRDDIYRNQLIEKGYERVKRFSWNESSKKLLEVFDRVLIKD